MIIVACSLPNLLIAMLIPSKETFIYIYDRDSIGLLPPDQGIELTILPAKRVIVTYTGDEYGTCKTRVSLKAFFLNE